MAVAESHALRRESYALETYWLWKRVSGEIGTESCSASSIHFSRSLIAIAATTRLSCGVDVTLSSGRRNQRRRAAECTEKGPSAYATYLQCGEDTSITE